MDEINKHLDSCTSYVHYDIAVIVYKVFKGLYRYIGARKWEYYDIDNNIWKKDVKTLRLKNDIKTIIVDLFIKRSVYWYELSSTYKNDIYADMRAKSMYEKMLKASYSLKSEKYISTVIKEARGFFDKYND